MSKITLEVLTGEDAYGSPYSVSLGLELYVHQRIEKFQYLQSIKDYAVPLDYVEGPKITSVNNLSIVNRAYGLSANSERLESVRGTWDVVLGDSIASPYKDILITNESTVDEFGKTKPLFYKHRLSDTVVECSLEVYKAGNRATVDSGYKTDMDKGFVYTNYQNFFDTDTGAYVLYYVVCTNREGEVSRSLLSPEPTVTEASWEDIDLDTGRVKDGLVVYSREYTTGGYVFYLNKADTWYYRPQRDSTLSPKRPGAIESDRPWYLKITNGSVVGVTNGEARRYYVPEFHQQAFAPYKPYVFFTYDELEKVSRNVLYASRRNLGINLEEGRHITIFIHDYEGNVIRALTTDSRFDGQRYQNTEVFYEVDKIQSWDNYGGFINLGIDIESSWGISAQYFYEAKDYEYNFVDLNFTRNKSIQNKMIVYYVIPDCGVNDRAVHHLIVDESGRIVDCSQTETPSYPNLKLKNADGSFNPNTIVGMKYFSEIEDCFLSDYTVGYTNDFAYLVLAEVVGVINSVVDDYFICDVRRQGGALVPETQEEALVSNPRILQSLVYDREYGQEVPKNAVVIIEAPLSLTQEYGGDFTKEEVVFNLVRHLDTNVYPVIQWSYDASELSATSDTTGQIDLTWSWEGPNQTYKLYRKDTRVGEWTLIQQVVSPAFGDITYTDTVDSGKVYHYTVRIEDDSVLFPRGNSVTIKAA